MSGTRLARHCTAHRDSDLDNSQSTESSPVAGEEEEERVEEEEGEEVEEKNVCI